MSPIKWYSSYILFPVMFLLAMDLQVVAAAQKISPLYAIDPTQSGATSDVQIAYNMGYVDLLQPYNSPFLIDAIKILNKINTTGPCSTQTALRLVTASRGVNYSVKNVDTINFLLDDLKSLYGIRMALCETGKGHAEVPFPCRAAFSLDKSLSQYTESTQAEIELSTAKTIPGCLSSLRKRHYYWTSYSSNLRDAAVLVKASDAGADGLRLAETARNVADAFSNLLQDMRMQATASEEAFRGVLVSAQELKAFQQQSLYLQNLSKANAQLISTELEETRKRLQHLSGNFRGVVADASLAVVEFVETDIDIIKAQLKTIKDELAGIQPQLVHSLVTDLSQVLRVTQDHTLSILENLEKQRLAQENHLHSTIETLRLQESSQLAAESLLLAFGEMTNSVHEFSQIAGPLRALSDLLHAHAKRLFNESIMFVFSFSTAAVLSCVPGLKLYGRRLALVYIWLVSTRIVIYQIGSMRKIRVIQNVLDAGQHYLQINCFVLGGILIATIAIICGLSRRSGKYNLSQDHADTRTRIRVLPAAQMGPLERSCGPEHRVVRAGTAPPTF